MKKRGFRLETKMLLDQCTPLVPAELRLLLVEALRFLCGLHGIGSRNMVLLAGLFTGLVALICWAVAVVDTGGFNGC